MLTARAFGSSSPKKRVNAVSTAVISPREADGKYSVAVATKRAVLLQHGSHSKLINLEVRGFFKKMERRRRRLKIRIYANYEQNRKTEVPDCSS